VDRVLVVHQKDIQRKGGVCAEYPVSCLIRDILRRAGLLKPFKQLKVLDLTYGEGRFWVALPQAVVIGFDIRRLEWRRKPARFFLESCENWRTRVPNEEFDLIVADPPFSPYKRGWEKRGHYTDNGNIALILNEARKASEHFCAPMLIHFMWKVVPPEFEIVDEAWFQGWSRLSKMPRPTWFGLLKPQVR